MDSESVTEHLFEIHKDYLNPKYIKRQQIKRLVEKVLSVCGVKDKENSDIRNSKAIAQSKAQPLAEKKKVEGYVPYTELERPAPQAKRSPTKIIETEQK